MRVNFIYNIRSYSGKKGRVVYYNYYNYQLCLVRKFVYPTLNENHLRMQDIYLHLNELYLASNEGYREDLKTYALRNSMENPERNHVLRHKMPNSKVLFTQCMWKWAEANPQTVNLQTVTLAEMIALDSPVCRVCTCVSAGYLKQVTGWERMDKVITG